MWKTNVKGIVEKLEKPYRRWSHDNVLAIVYRKRAGKRFGLGPENGWSMRAPSFHGRQLQQLLPNLHNVAPFTKENNESMTIMPYEVNDAVNASQRNNVPDKCSLVMLQSLGVHNVVMIFGTPLGREERQNLTVDVVMMD